MEVRILPQKEREVLSLLKVSSAGIFQHTQIAGTPDHRGVYQRFQPEPDAESS